MQQIFDSHAHYDGEQFDEDRDTLLASMPEKGVSKIVNIGCDLESSIASFELAKKYPHIYATAGVHPHDAKTLNDEVLLAIEKLLKEEKVVALGEIGLDYFYKYSDEIQQRSAFIKQLELAHELSMPVVIHSRDATQETFEIIKKYRPKGVVHCFSGSAEMAEEYTKLGLYIGFTGVVTFSNAKKTLKAAAVVPEHLLLIETDCPYMAPTPHRGKRCDSTMLPLIAQAIADVRGVTAEKIIELTYHNAMRCYEMK